jgi:hypothetical protein
MMSMRETATSKIASARAGSSARKSIRRVTTKRSVAAWPTPQATAYRIRAEDDLCSLIIVVTATTWSGSKA